MTEDDHNLDQDTPPQPSSKRGWLIAFLIILVLALGGACYALWRHHPINTTLAKNQITIHQLAQQNHEQAEALSELQKKIQSLQVYHPTHSGLASLLAAEETAQLAQYQLNYNHNSRAAAQWLSLAKQQLSAQHLPSLHKVIYIVQKNIHTLEQHPIPPSNETIQTIASIKASLAAWHPATKATAHHAIEKAISTDLSGHQPNRWDRLWQQIKIALNKMVIISHSQTPQAYPTIWQLEHAQSDAVFLLSQAQWAIMSHDIQHFRECMQHTIIRLHQAFPQRHAMVVAMIAQCEKLLQSYQHLDKLSIQPSLSAIHQAMQPYATNPKVEPTSHQLPTDKNGSLPVNPIIPHDVSPHIFKHPSSRGSHASENPRDPHIKVDPS